MLSGFTVRAATAAGLKAGSVARLALSLSLGAASSSSFVLLDSQTGSSDRLAESSESLRQTESRLLAAEDDEEDDDLGSSSLTTICSSSTSLGLDSRVRAVLDDAWRSLMLLTTCTGHVSLVN